MFIQDPGSGIRDLGTGNPKVTRGQFTFSEPTHVFLKKVRTGRQKSSKLEKKLTKLDNRRPLMKD